MRKSLKHLLKDAHNGKGVINVLHVAVGLSKTCLDDYVLAEWNMIKQQLRVWFVNNQQPREMKFIQFEINPNSK